MVEPVIIAIDGPSASGKGTLAKKLAAHFDYAYLDTGRLYRAVAAGVLERGLPPEDTAGALKVAQNLDLTLLDDAKLRSRAVATAASIIAAQPGIRAALLAFQRNFAATPPNNKRGAVLDGRDIGTVICPDADYKLYVTASAKTRAERRFAELSAQNPDLNPDDILTDIRARDQRDETRATAPSKRDENAYLLDSTNLSIEEAFEAALAYIASKSERR